MRAVPVQAVLRGHVVSDEDDPSHLHLDSQVQAMEPGVSGPPDGACFHELEPIVILVQPTLLMPANRRQDAASVESRSPASSETSL